MHRILVVELVTGGFVLFVKLAGGQHYRQICMRKYEAPRVFRDYARMRIWLSEPWVNWANGPLFVYPEGHPFLARLGIAIRR